MKQRDYLVIGIIAILGILVIIGCVKQQITLQSTEEKTFSSFVNGIDLELPYTINVFSSHESSGGGTKFSETKVIESAELKEIVNEIKLMKIVGSFIIGTRNCFYSGGQSPDYFVCFADNKIVNYVKDDGPSYYQLNAVGYEFNIGRSTIISSINNLKRCDIDSDCILTSSGVCDPTGQCTTISAACDPGCRTSINAKHFLIWDFVPLVEDQCITDKCASYEQREYFEASCVNNVCEAKIVK